MQHPVFLGLFAGLAAGFFAITFLPRADGVFAGAVARMRVALLFYNVWVLSYVVLAYVRQFVLTLMSASHTALVEDAGVFVIALLGVCWLYSHVLVVEDLQPDSNGPIAPALRSLLTILGVSLVVSALVLLLTGSRTLFLLLTSWAGPVLAPIGLTANVALLVAVRAAKRAPSHGLSVLASGYVVLFAGFMLYVMFTARLQAISPGWLKGYDLVFGVLYNMIPVIWCRPLGAAAVVEPSMPYPLGGPSVEALIARFHITRREHEVVELICRGWTNQEIADQLFISLRTVKDHNSTIFQKTGVRNRTELTNLFNASIRRMESLDPVATDAAQYRNCVQAGRGEGI